MNSAKDLEFCFQKTCDLLLGELLAGEALALDFSGEISDFMRFNHGQVRQIGSVQRAESSLTYFRDQRTITSSFELTGVEAKDIEYAANALTLVRREASLLPEDPYQTLPATGGSSRNVFSGRLLEPEQIPDEILGPGEILREAGADFVGLFSQGAICRGTATSAGARHWFATENFVVDYSAYLPSGKAVKSVHAGTEWDTVAYASRLASIIPHLTALAQPARTLPPGEYRVYITPDALYEFVPFFSWNGLGERCMREGESSYLALRDGRKSMSPAFHLTQDFSLGLEPRFNELGEVAAEKLVLIEGGKLVNTLVSARSNKQYGVPSNAAPESEDVRCPAIGAGQLDAENALTLLGTGIYISNLHYLNWSDNDSGRITGMTRFACFWVEEGKIVAPIQDMRFDESIYHLFGDKLLGLTRQRSLVPETGSYGLRSLGGALLPGLLVDRFPFTL
jgi:predicted Zn-dependent protease